METEEIFEMFILLEQARDAMYDARNKELKKYGISPRESAVLHAIANLGESVNPTLISRSVDRKPHTIASILQRMQRKGLVKLTKDSQIKNIVRMKLTEKGTVAHRASLKRKSIVDIVEIVNNDEMEQLKTTLVNIHKTATTRARAARGI